MKNKIIISVLLLIFVSCQKNSELRFEELDAKYGIYIEDDTDFNAELIKNGWLMSGCGFYVHGDLSVMGKSEYDYLWRTEKEEPEGLGINKIEPYVKRLNYLNEIILS